MLVNINSLAVSEVFLKISDRLTLTENSDAGPVLYPVAKKKIVKKSGWYQRKRTIIKQFALQIVWKYL